MKKERELSTGEFVVITEANGKLITTGELEDIWLEKIYKSTIIFTIKTRKETRTYTTYTDEVQNIRLMRFDEMNLRTRISWFWHNVLFKSKFNKTYKNVVENED